MIDANRLQELLRSLCPPVTTRLCRTMQPTLYGYIRQATSRQQVRLCVLAGLLFPLSMAPLEIQRRMIDDAIAGGDVGLLILLAALYAAVLITHGLLKYAFNVYQSSVGEGVIRVLRLRINDVVHGRGAGPSGNPATLSAAEAEQVGGFVGEAVSFPFLQGGIFLTTLGYMIWLNPIMAAVALVSVVPSLIVTPALQASINRYIHKRVEVVRFHGEQLAAMLGGDRQNADRANRLVELAYGYRIKIFALKFLLKALNNLLASLGPVLILLFGGWLVIDGSAKLGAIVAFISGFERLTTPTRELLNYYRRISQVNVQYALLAKTLR